jgi:hypothetical protein
MAVFDELEGLASDPSRIPQPTPEWGSVHPFALVHDGNLHIVTPYLAHDERRQVLTLLGVRVFSAG